MKAFVVVIVLPFVLFGCDSKTEQRPKPKTQSSDVATSEPAAPMLVGKAIVRGKIVLSGSSPVMKEIPNTFCQCPGPRPIMDESVIVSDGGGLKNVLVSIEGIGPGAPPAEAPVLDQINCVFVPHVVGITVGQRLKTRSSDETLHNVQLIGSKGPVENFVLTRANEERFVTVGYADMLTASCSAHPWMKAYVGVFENPFFTVTAAGGSFEPTGIPAGSYTLVAWHERYGRLEFLITLSDERPAEVNL